jgi:hypothetical protein
VGVLLTLLLFLPPPPLLPQVGPCLGMEGGDHMWMSRFLLERICEIYNVEVTLDPKPIPGGYGCVGCAFAETGGIG